MHDLLNVLSVLTFSEPPYANARLSVTSLPIPHIKSALVQSATHSKVNLQTTAASQRCDRNSHLMMETGAYVDTFIRCDGCH